MKLLFVINSVMFYLNNKNSIHIYIYIYIYIKYINDGDSRLLVSEIAIHLIYCELGHLVICKTLQHTPKTWTEVHVRITCTNAYANDPGIQSL